MCYTCQLGRKHAFNRPKETGKQYKPLECIAVDCKRPLGTRSVHRHTGFYLLSDHSCLFLSPTSVLHPVSYQSPACSCLLPVSCILSPTSLLSLSCLFLSPTSVLHPVSCHSPVTLLSLLVSYQSPASCLLFPFVSVSRLLSCILSPASFVGRLFTQFL
jgi:hypothetical protein